MGYIVKNNTSIFVVEEDTEGTYEAASVGTEAIQPLSDGFEITPSKELLERGVMSGTIGMAAPRTGMKSVKSTIPCEFRAADVAGAIPDYSLLLESALGSVKTVAEITTIAGNSASSLQLPSGSGALFEAGDIILIKDAGKYHVTPIASVEADKINLLIPTATVAASGTKISAVSVFSPANSGHPSLTVESWLEGTRKEVATGCKVNSVKLNNFSTGKLADLSFGLEGAGFEQSIDTLGVVPDFQSSLPPVILNACVYQDGVKVPVNEFTFSIENSLGWITSTCSPNGKISSRVTSRKITGTINPYKQSDSVSNYNKFNANTSFSLFAYAYNPSAVAGEFNQVVAVYLPQCLITEIGVGDKDGVVQEALTFSAHRGSENDKKEIFIASI